MSIAGVQVNIGRQIAGNFQGNAAVAGFQPPAGIQRRARVGADFHTAVSGLELKFVKATAGSDVAITGGGVQLPLYVVEVLGTIPRVQVHASFEAGNLVCRLLLEKNKTLEIHNTALHNI